MIELTGKFKKQYAKQDLEVLWAAILRTYGAQQLTLTLTLTLPGAVGGDAEDLRLSAAGGAGGARQPADPQPVLLLLQHHARQRRRTQQHDVQGGG